MADAKYDLDSLDRLSPTDLQALEAMVESEWGASGTDEAIEQAADQVPGLDMYFEGGAPSQREYPNQAEAAMQGVKKIPGDAAGIAGDLEWLPRAAVHYGTEAAGMESPMPTNPDGSPYTWAPTGDEANAWLDENVYGGVFKDYEHPDNQRAELAARLAGGGIYGSATRLPGKVGRAIRGNARPMYPGAGVADKLGIEGMDAAKYGALPGAGYYAGAEAASAANLPDWVGGVPMQLAMPFAPAVAGKAIKPNVKPGTQEAADVETLRSDGEYNLDEGSGVTGSEAVTDIPATRFNTKHLANAEEAKRRSDVAGTGPGKVLEQIEERGLRQATHKLLLRTSNHGSEYHFPIEGRRPVLQETKEVLRDYREGEIELPEAIHRQQRILGEKLNDKEAMLTLRPDEEAADFAKEAIEYLKSAPGSTATSIKALKKIRVAAANRQPIPVLEYRAFRKDLRKIIDRKGSNEAQKAQARNILMYYDDLAMNNFNERQKAHFMGLKEAYANLSMINRAWMKGEGGDYVDPELVKKELKTYWGDNYRGRRDEFKSITEAAARRLKKAEAKTKAKDWQGQAAAAATAGSLTYNATGSLGAASAATAAAMAYGPASRWNKNRLMGSPEYHARQTRVGSSFADAAHNTLTNPQSAAGMPVRVPVGTSKTIQDSKK